jgi:hypothetical protein
MRFLYLELQFQMFTKEMLLMDEVSFKQKFIMLNGELSLIDGVTFKIGKEYFDNE